MDEKNGLRALSEPGKTLVKHRVGVEAIRCVFHQGPADKNAANTETGYM